MKNIKLYIALLLISFAISSCFKDDSTFADFRYPLLHVHEGPKLTAVYLEDYSFTPQFETIVGRDTTLIDESEYDNYMYEWRIYTNAGDTDSVSLVLSREHELSMQLNMVIPAEDSYFLVLRLTNKEGGFTQTFDWQIEVLSSKGQGLIIADTEDGGLSTDLNLLVTRAYSKSFTDDDEEVVYRDIYSGMNGEKMSGLVSQLAFCNVDNNRTISALVKGKALYEMNSMTYKLENNNNPSEYFYFEPEIFNPQYVVGHRTSYTMLINNGIAYARSPEYQVKYSYVDEATYKYDLKGGFNYLFYNGNFGGNLTCYDEKNNQFVFVNSLGKVVEITPPTVNDEWAFDPTALPENIEYVTGGVRGYNDLFILMKAKTTNKFTMYKLTAKNRKVSGDAVYDMSNCDGLDRATAYAFSRKADEFYYTVDNELHVAILNVDAPSSTVVYSLPAGENFTNLLVNTMISGKTAWSETTNDDGVTSPVWTGSLDKVITAASYNGTEGFIRTLPIQYSGAGGIAEEKWVHTYGGFGKITALVSRR